MARHGVDEDAPAVQAAVTRMLAGYTSDATDKTRTEVTAPFVTGEHVLPILVPLFSERDGTPSRSVRSRCSSRRHRSA